MTDRPYIRKSSLTPPSPDRDTVSCGIQCFRWFRRGAESQRLRDARAALKAVLAGETTTKGGES
jgi:hypothetical protein